MRVLLAILVLVLLVLQYRLWFAEGSLAEQHRLQEQVEHLQHQNRELAERNSALERDVMELKSGLKGIEQRARSELGLVGENEVFYQFVDPEHEPGPQENVEIRLPEGVTPPEPEAQ